MKRGLVALVLAVLALPGLGAAPLANADGWANLHWGMSRDGVLKAQPNARLTAGKESGTTDVDLGDLQVFGGTFSGHAVILDDKGLTSIRISTLGRKEMPNRQAVAAMVGDIRNELTLKYGSPGTKEGNTLVWQLEKLRIVLGWSMDAGILIVTFRNPAAISSPKP